MLVGHRVILGHPRHCAQHFFQRPHVIGQSADDRSRHASLRARNFGLGAQYFDPARQLNVQCVIRPASSRMFEATDCIHLVKRSILTFQNEPTGERPRTGKKLSFTRFSQECFDMMPAPSFKHRARSTGLVVVFFLAAAHGGLTSAQELAPDPYFSPIADKSTPLMPRVILRNIREDRDGNIWFASFGGPIRYDGKEFTNFAEEAGIAGRRIFSLIVAKSGALWFGSITGGASKYDGKSFTRFTTKEGLPDNDVLWIFEDKKGDIWLATNEGVSRYDGKSFIHYSAKDGLPHNSVYAIAQDRSGTLWFGTQDGIASYDGKTFTNFASIAGREFQNIRSIVEDKAGNLWFGGQFGVYRYDGKTGEMLKAKDGLLSNFVGSMIVDKAGCVWFGHPDEDRGGATRYDGKTFTHFTQEEGLPSTNVYCMLEDRDGRIWFGSVGYGASRYDGKTFTNFSPK
jgi:streptogramin lyase